MASDQTDFLEEQELSERQAPLAEKLRPRSLRELRGQEKLVSSNSLLCKMLESNDYHSFILWGPPGTGKTTIARIIEHASPVAWSPDNTLKNLEYAADGEHEEWTELYPVFADIAEEEGYKDIAASWRLVAMVEKEHEKRFRKLYDNVKDLKVFKKDSKVFWKCLNCGYIHEGAEAPAMCPCCVHPQSYFEIHCETY
jgi:rubrerythrin